ncbi:hypothetical protein CASFOL_034050 [Castilleja foliolosa]|uniref:RRM domain-containing protein n=1 Tax=Castilleja foliolosa TaxID=1961234 RepID=A0ABD3BZJ3_9LAMI
MAEFEAPQQHLGQHRGAVVEEKTSSSSSVTLLVRHLPEAIPPETINRLFSHYGASSVRPSSHGRVKNCVFVDFKNELSASQAQKQLHGLQFLGKVFSVERASKSIDALKIEQEGETETRKVKHASVPGDNSRGSSYIYASEPIAGKLGVEYPFPPHLEYAYPPPDGHILTNVVNALIAVPRFYTQVLHLMNKMNIPAPFRSALPTPPLPASVPVPPPPPSAETNVKFLSSSESEMESSDEEARPEARPKRKRVKRQSIVGPGVDNDVAHEAVGLKQVELVPKEKPIIKKNTVLQIRIAPKQMQPEVKDDVAAKESQEKNTFDRGTYATLEEIQSGKLPPEEILSLPRFKNYTAGDPTPVLYVKNLAKDVVVDDFYFIFGSLFGSSDAAKSSLSVKLMQIEGQIDGLRGSILVLNVPRELKNEGPFPKLHNLEGRMRGQAFLTFPTLELARNALNVVNGYVFKGKPMVIQFGRSPTAGAAAATPN